MRSPSNNLLGRNRRMLTGSERVRNQVSVAINAFLILLQFAPEDGARAEQPGRNSMVREMAPFAGSIVGERPVPLELATISGGGLFYYATFREPEREYLIEARLQHKPD